MVDIAQRFDVSIGRPWLGTGDCCQCLKMDAQWTNDREWWLAVVDSGSLLVVMQNDCEWLISIDDMGEGPPKANNSLRIGEPSHHGCTNGYLESEPVFDIY